jgi:hypothetical protein
MRLLCGRTARKSASRLDKRRNEILCADSLIGPRDREHVEIFGERAVNGQRITEFVRTLSQHRIERCIKGNS